MYDANSFSVSAGAPWKFTESRKFGSSRPQMSLETGAPDTSAVPERHPPGITASNRADLPQASNACTNASAGVSTFSWAFFKGSAGLTASPPVEWA